MSDEFSNRNGRPQSHGDAPAFPVSIPGAGDNGWHGMSLRDWFAGLAMQAAFGAEYKSVVVDTAKLSAEAYEMADKMIAARGLTP